MGRQTASEQRKAGMDERKEQKRADVVGFVSLFVQQNHKRQTLSLNFKVGG